MPLHHAIILGIVQGLTEFLPISSTAHLILVRRFLGWPDPGLTFDVALHVGTFLAVAVYFRAELGRVVAGGLRTFHRPAPLADPDQRLAWMLVLGTIPAGLAGVLLEEKVETVFRSTAVIGVSLVVVALAITAAERLARRSRELEGAGYADAVVVGVAQAVALVPGVSRSGATIAMGLFCGLTRDGAARLAFLLGVPAIFGACVFKVKDVLEGAGGIEPLSFLAGIATSAIVGYASISGLLAYVRASSFAVFVIYRLALGAAVLALDFAGKM